MPHYAMNARQQKLRTIGNRLAPALLVLVLVAVPGATLAFLQLGQHIITTPMVVFAVGVIGGFVGLQRRLKAMDEDDLTLLANSWVYVCLSPLVGGILAVLTYVLFLSGLLAGQLFPAFLPDPDAGEVKGLPLIFAVHCGTAADYAKVLFWSFVAGFSERFATDIIGRLDARAGAADAPEPPDHL